MIMESILKYYTDYNYQKQWKYSYRCYEKKKIIKSENQTC